ncbi:hypothetical protein NHX12_031386 [Muraenolepis orangiensis]|uniref:Amino acid transporter transmembrane domain-containing protein n=1 Tax=Muraenolepis orangiensis TaxID=630683 RepID=A0A9Q0IHA8_9TELE|nr:hypothetical protein NHX12_031386 [Muraenolepis orangiensis]
MAGTAVHSEQAHAPVGGEVRWSNGPTMGTFPQEKLVSLASPHTSRSIGAGTTNSRQAALVFNPHMWSLFGGGGGGGDLWSVTMVAPPCLCDDCVADAYQSGCFLGQRLINVGSIHKGTFVMMIILALIRIAKGRGEGRPPVASLSGVPNLFGVCVYSFMCQHSLPSLVTPVSNKSRVGTLVVVDYVLILCFYLLLSFTAVFCFDNELLHDMYTLNFSDNCDVLDTPVLRYFLGLFPVFTISTNFPIIAVTLRNNWKTLFHRDGGTYPWVVDRLVFPLITVVPPVLVAFATHNLESLVGITGAYAGTGIQYIVPAFLVYLSRRHLEPTVGRAEDTPNKHRSPFRHVFWVWFVVAWAAFCLVFVTANIILTDTKK